MTATRNRLITGPEDRLSVRVKGLDSRPQKVVVQGANLSGQTGYEQSDSPKGPMAVDKRFFIIPDSGDYGHLQRPRAKFHKAIADFIQDT